jgi:hypothetical protein
MAAGKDDSGTACCNHLRRRPHLRRPLQPGRDDGSAGPPQDRDRRGRRLLDRAGRRQEQQGNGFYGLAIGFTVAAAAFAVGGVSGGVFNPQVALGGATGGVFAWSTIWIYLVVQLGAGIIAGLAFLVLDPGDSALRTYTGGSNHISRPAGPNPVPAQRGDAPGAWGCRPGAGRGY